MSNQFFIWKDAECKGKDPVWIELSGEDLTQSKVMGTIAGGGK